MATPGKSSKGQVDKEITKKRTKLMQESQKYWRVLQKKWGAKDVGLRFGSGNRNAGEYHQEWNNKGAYVELFFPGVSGWSNVRGTTTLTSAKRIMRHEMAHHRQQVKSEAGKEGVGMNPDVHLPTQNERWHGPAFQKQEKQIGGGRDQRATPRTLRPKKKGPGGRPAAKMSRKNIARRRAAQLGPKPKSRSTDAQRRRQSGTA